MSLTCLFVWCVCVMFLMKFYWFSKWVCVCVYTSVPSMLLHPNMVDKVIRVEIYLLIFLLALSLIFYEHFGVAKLKLFLYTIFKMLHICGIHTHLSVVYCGLLICACPICAYPWSTVALLICMYLKLNLFPSHYWSSSVWLWIQAV